MSGSGLESSLLYGPGLDTGLLYARSMLREPRPRRSAVQPGSGLDGPLQAWDSEVMKAEAAPDTMQLADTWALAAGSKPDGLQLADSSELAVLLTPGGLQMADSELVAVFMPASQLRRLLIPESEPKEELLADASLEEEEVLLADGELRELRLKESEEVPIPDVVFLAVPSLVTLLVE